MAQKKRQPPKPETLKINGNWVDAVKRSFQKKKPKGG
jgi:hypothetical protein